MVTDVTLDVRRFHNHDNERESNVRVSRLSFFFERVNQICVMKSFFEFRLDTVNHLLWRNDDRVPLAPKAFDVLSYLVTHAGRVVTQEEIFDALWANSFVNPEVLRKYILEIRRALGDKAGDPKFIETLPKRGYRFVAPIYGDSNEAPGQLIPSEPAEGVVTASIDRSILVSRHKRVVYGLLVVMTIIGVAGLLGSFQKNRNERGAAPTPNRASIAVLPFVDMNLTKDQEYFSEGLSEQLINCLARASGLVVVGRSSSFQFKGHDDDLRDVGHKLGVANILEGSVRRDGDHVRITAELIQASNGYQLWSQTYEREINDVFTVEDEIAESVTQALKLKLLGGTGQPVALSSQSTNSEAYQAYLKANHSNSHGESPAKTLTLVNTTIELDQKYAPSWALRAWVEYEMADRSMTEPTDGFRQARADAERAVALDPTLSSGYLVLAALQLTYDWNWDAADASISKAESLAPGSVEVLRIRAKYLRTLGHVDEAVKCYQRAVVRDPLRPGSYVGLGYLLYTAGRYDEARVSLQKALDLNPAVSDVHLDFGKMYMAEWKPQQALFEFEKEPDDIERLVGDGIAYYALGRKTDANAALNTLIQSHGTDSAYQIAQVYSSRQEPDDAFLWLNRAYKQRDSGLLLFNTEPLFRNLRSDSRYADLLKRMHLSTR